jgi:thiol-disulfide isomerase/thioredoxin
MKMNLIKTILSVCIITILTSCSSNVNLKPASISSNPIFVTGKVLNPSSDNSTVTIYVNDILSGDQKTYVSLIDSAGDFQIKFNQYYSQDVLVRYGDNAFPIIVHPKDSIHIVFDTNKLSNKDELAKTIQFSGNAVDINSNLIIFHSKISKIFIPWEQYCQYEKKFSPTEFTAILDSLKSARKTVLNDFFKTQNPSQELKNWMMHEINMDYYNWLARYPDHHAKYNNLDKHSVVLPSFYDFMKLQFSHEMLYNSKSVSFLSFYNHGRINTLSKKYCTKNIIGYFLKRKEGVYFGSSTEQNIEVIENNTEDKLLKEISIAKCLFSCLERREIVEFEKHLPFFDKTIKEPFLKEPLINKYLETKRHFENPVLDKNSLVITSKETPANALIEKIIQENKGKIIYLDIWATWCSPCRKEMPSSKRLMKELNDDKVAFVYLCIDSEKDKWKALISEMGIEGRHYFASPDQSRFVYKLFEMTGVPQYVLIDKKGNIIDKGFQLRPSENQVKTKILNLLTNKKSA